MQYFLWFKCILSLGFNKTCGLVMSPSTVLSPSIMPHQTHWLYKVIGQPATFPLNRPWNWLSRPRCYYLDVSHLQCTTFNNDMKARRKEHRVFVLFRPTLWWWSSYRLPAPTSSLLLLVSNPNKWSLPLWKFFTEAFQGRQGVRSDIWEPITVGCYRGRREFFL